MCMMFVYAHKHVPRGRSYWTTIKSASSVCDVPRLDVLTYTRQFLLWAYFTYLL